jgi:hypothetical protein
VRWVSQYIGTGIPHLTPTLSAPRGGEGGSKATTGKENSAMEEPINLEIFTDYV